MDKKTRVRNCIDSKPIDKVPFTFWHHYFGEEKENKACVAAHKRIYEECGFDFIKMMSDGFFPIDFGVDKIETANDWAKLKIPKMSDPYIRGQIDRIKMMREAVKDECCIYYILFSVLGFLRWSYTYELVVDHLLDPAKRKLLMPTYNNLGDFVAEMAETFIKEGGADGIHMSMSGMFYFTDHPEVYKECIQPQDWKIMKQANAASDYNILHLCGNAQQRNELSWMRDYETAVLHWDQHTDQIYIPEAREYFPNKRAIMGGFDNHAGSLLYTSSKEDLKAMTKEYVKSGGSTGFIMSADCSLIPEVDYARLRWIGEALEEIGA